MLGNGSCAARDWLPCAKDARNGLTASTCSFTRVSVYSRKGLKSFQGYLQCCMACDVMVKSAFQLIAFQGR